MAGPKIKVEADLSSFDAELNKLKSSIAQMGDQLKTSSGKAHFNFEGSQKELNSLIHQAEKLTSALDKGNKTSVQYAKNLKAAQEAMAGAAKVAAKLESAGDAKTNRASGYFREYSGELGQESHEVSSRNAIQRERERTQAKIDADRHAANAKWASRAAKFAGFIGGSVMGGGGGYATMGAGLGSMLPGPWGMVGGAVGGAIGGVADRTIGPARAEAKMYSELRRSLGSTTTDFENLRDSVRSVITGLGVTDNEAANLAKQFAKTAGLSGNSTDAIARGVGTSAGFAQGYGISPEQATEFFSSMKLVGGASNDKDSRRLALMIGESVAKGGTGGKMDEVLSVISGYASKIASQTLTGANVGQYASYLSTGTGSPYAGLHSNPNGVAQLMSQADSSVAAGGGRGEASQNQWLQARMTMFPGMSATDNSLMQNTGAFGDLASQFKPGSAYYDQADPNARARMNALLKSIKSSGYSNNTQLGMDRAKAISGGNSDLENQAVQGLFGINPQQAAALQQIVGKDGGLGGFESSLKKQGIDLSGVSMSQVGAMASLHEGGDKAFLAQYKKLHDSGKLTSAEISAGDKALGVGGDEFKKMVYKLTKDHDADDGLSSQVTQISLSNKIQENTSQLVGIESDMREYLLRLLDKFGAADAVHEHIAQNIMAGNPEDGTNMRGGKGYGGRSKDLMMREVNRGLSEISMGGTQDQRDAAYNRVMGDMSAHPDYYPKQMMEWAKKARGGHESAIDAPALPIDNSSPTLPSFVSPGKNSGVVGIVNSASPYDSLFSEAGKKYGIDPLVLKQLAAQESGLNPNATHNNGSSTDYGMMQHNSRYMSERGLDSGNWSDPRANIMAGAEFLKQKLDQSGGDYHEAFRRYSGSGIAAEQYADNSMATFDAVHADKMPKDQLKSMTNPRDSSIMFRHDVGITLNDMAGNKVAPAFVSSVFGAPSAAGA